MTNNVLIDSIHLNLIQNYHMACLKIQLVQNTLNALIPEVMLRCKKLQKYLRNTPFILPYASKLLEIV